MDLKFPATQPDQTLCFENKRRIIHEKHSAWMEQRDQALAADKDGNSTPTLSETLDDIHAASLAAVSRYDDEKRQLAKLPPARRRAVMAQKRASWMDQRGEEAPSLRLRERQPAEVRSPTAPGAADTGGNQLLAQLHAERQARISAAVPTRARPAQSPLHTALMSQPTIDDRQEGMIPARSIRPAQQPTGLAWSCSACTFAHAAPALACEMCGILRDSAASATQSRCGSDSGDVDDLHAELGLADDNQLDEIENFLAAVELDLQRDD